MTSLGYALFAAGAAKSVADTTKSATPAPILETTTAEKETDLEQQAKAAEKQRRMLIAAQNRTIKTTALGAQIGQNKLGGMTLTGY